MEKLVFTIRHAVQGIEKVEISINPLYQEHGCILISDNQFSFCILDEFEKKIQYQKKLKIVNRSFLNIAKGEQSHAHQQDTQQKSPWLWKD